VKQNSRPSTEVTKILHVHTRAVVGGSGKNTLCTIEKLPKEKFCGHFACGIKDAQKDFLEDVAARDIVFHPIPHLVNQINPLEDFLALLEMARLIRREHYTIVHTHNSKAGILGRLAAKICGVPIVIHTIHSCEFHYEGTGLLARRLFIFLEALAARLTTHFIAISRHLKNEFIKYRVAPEERISVIYSGIEIEKFKSPIHFVDTAKKRGQLGLKEDDFVVGVIARLEKGKGHETLMEAAKIILQEHSLVKFLIVGDGTLRAPLEALAKCLGIDRHLVFTGFRYDVAEILKAVDLVCVPSFYEGMGRIVLEAQASGKAVVATRAGGIPEIVEEGKTAILIEPKNPYALAQAVLKLAKDSCLREEIGKAGSVFVDTRFSEKKMADDICALYEKLLAQTFGSIS